MGLDRFVFSDMNYNPVVMEHLRFCCIEILTVTTQNLSIAQIVIIWVVNTSFLTYYFYVRHKVKKMNKKIKVLDKITKVKMVPSTIMEIKHISQEICIFLILTAFLSFAIVSDDKSINKGFVMILQYAVMYML